MKRILRYINNAVNYGVFYPKSSTFDLLSYSDADFAGCISDWKSTSGTCHFLGHLLVSCSVKSKIMYHYQQPKQNISLLVLHVLRFYG